MWTLKVATLETDNDRSLSWKSRIQLHLQFVAGALPQLTSSLLATCLTYALSNLKVYVCLNLLFSTGKPKNVFLRVLRQETGFSWKDNPLTQTWVSPCWHCSWVCFDSKLDAAVLIVQWTQIWRGTNRLWTLDSSSYSNVPLTPSADENSTKLGAVHICPQHHHKTRQLLRTVWVGQKRSLKGCQRTQKSTPLTKLNSW